MKLISLLVLVGGLGLALSLGELRAQTGEGVRSQTTYFPSGRIQTEVEVEAGAKQGAFHRYRPDGSLETEGQYAAGRMEGTWRWWRPDGSLDLDRSGLYRDGERVEPLP